MSTLWDQIHTNFKNCIEDSVTGVNSLTAVTITFAEAEDVVELKSLPTSIFDGKYSIQLDSIDSVERDIATGIADYSYNVKYQFAFELNEHDGKDDYNNAIGCLEEVVRRRLNRNTWPSTIFHVVTFKSLYKLEFLTGTERFAIADIVFNIKGRTSLA